MPAHSRGSTIRAKVGFNLVELLVGVAVLFTIVTMVASIFRNSDAAWSQGTGSSDTDAAGRRVLRILTDDIQYAVTGSNLTFVARPDPNGVIASGVTNSELCFLTLSGESATTNRALREVMYWVRGMTNQPGRYELVRGWRSPSNATNDCYANASWYRDVAEGGMGRPSDDGHVGVLAENVTAFETTTFISSNNVDSRSFSFDVCIELLNDRDARQAADMQTRGIGTSSFIERNVRRYGTTITLLNWNGYLQP